jgi:glycerol-3-phosphate dehydrogenase subunit B
MSDVLVIGAGLTGLTAAWQVARQGKKVRLVARGWGITHWHAGCIDVLGYYAPVGQAAVKSPGETVAQLVADQPRHPLALAGINRLAEALEALQALCAEAGYPLRGSLARNWLLPSAVGAFRPTCLAPETMIAGDLSLSAAMLIVGFKQLGDFYPHVAADNLTQQGIPAAHAMLDLPLLRERNFTTSTILAGLLDQPDFRQQVAAAVKPHIDRAERIGFPAVLGMKQPLLVKQDLEAKLGRPVFEIPILPPSVPGIRLHHILKQAIERQGGQIYTGMEVVGAAYENRHIVVIYTQAAARQQSHYFDQYVLATGGILGGGIHVGHEGEAREIIFDLPVTVPTRRSEWFKQDFLDEEGHPIYQAGLRVNQQFQPLNEANEPVYRNLFAAGTTLAHAEVIRERSLEGVALVTGYVVGQGLGSQGGSFRVQEVGNSLKRKLT